jgi:hypothetical protein
LYSFFHGDNIPEIISAIAVVNFNSIKGTTINVYSDGGGDKRGIFVSSTNIVSTRDTNIYVAAPKTPNIATGTYVGIETADSSNIGSIQLRATTVGCVKPTAGQTYTASDILQTYPSTVINPTYLATAGIQIGPGVDLVTKSAGNKPFSTYVYPTTIYYGLRGNLRDGLNANTNGYLWPGTQAASKSGPNSIFPDTTLPPAFYRMQQPTILAGINISVTTPPGASNVSTVFTVSHTPVGTSNIVPIPGYSIILLSTNTNKSFYNTSHDLEAGDLLHLGVVYNNGASNNATADITVQLDLF